MLLLSIIFRSTKCNIHIALTILLHLRPLGSKLHETTTFQPTARDYSMHYGHFKGVTGIYSTWFCLGGGQEEVTEYWQNRQLRQWIGNGLPHTDWEECQHCKFGQIFHSFTFSAINGSITLSDIAVSSRHLKKCFYNILKYKRLHCKATVCDS